MVLVDITDRNVPDVLGKVVSRHKLRVGLGIHEESLWRPPLTAIDTLSQSLDQQTRSNWPGPGTLPPACLSISQTIANLMR